MNEKDRAVFSNFTKKVKQIFPDASVMAFGSRAKGNPAVNSDLDVCVVVETLNDEVDQIIMDQAWEVGIENDIIISTITYNRAEFEDGVVSHSPIVKTILKEGITA